MKYCEQCGRGLLDDAQICPGCGCSAKEPEAVPSMNNPATTNEGMLLVTLSQRLNINGIIWLVIGILQILAGLFFQWFLLIVGILNIISAAQDMQYSKMIFHNQRGIVQRFKPLTGPIITLVYNLLIGGIIGVIGSLYYFIAIRTFVLENKPFFESLDEQ